MGPLVVFFSTGCPRSRARVSISIYRPSTREAFFPRRGPARPGPRSRHPAAPARILRCLQARQGCPSHHERLVQQGCPRRRNPLSTSSPWEAAARYRSSSGSSGCACTPVRLTGSSAAPAWLLHASTTTSPASSTRHSTPLCRSNQRLQPVCHGCIIASPGCSPNYPGTSSCRITRSGTGASAR